MFEAKFLQEKIIVEVQKMAHSICRDRQALSYDTIKNCPLSVYDYFKEVSFTRNFRSCSKH